MVNASSSFIARKAHDLQREYIIIDAALTSWMTAPQMRSMMIGAMELPTRQGDEGGGCRYGVRRGHGYQIEDKFTRMRPMYYARLPTGASR
jgi:hypothetical protein